MNNLDSIRSLNLDMSRNNSNYMYKTCWSLDMIGDPIPDLFDILGWKGRIKLFCFGSRLHGVLASLQQKQGP